MKKLISLFLSTVLVIGIVPSVVFADYDMYGAEPVELFAHLGYSDDDGLKCYYDDNYFAESSYSYNASLSTMTLCMALSATGVPDENYVGGSKNIEKLMSDMGMDKIAHNEWYDKKPATDSIAVACGSKKIDDYTLIAIAVRGGGYGSEWSSNFDMGPSGNHEGFEKAANDVLDFVDDFISNNEIDGEVKFWITGYSRGAATANLVAGKLDSSNSLFDGDVSYEPSDVFAYCFETPCGTLKTTNDSDIELYSNIFNITNPNDIVTYVAPTTDGFGFGRYGTDIYLPSAESSPDYLALRERMMNVYESLPYGGNYVIDNFEPKRLSLDISSLANGNMAGTDGSEDSSDAMDTSSFYYGDPNGMTQREFFKNLIDTIGTDFVGGRTKYVESYQVALMTMFSLMLGTEGEQMEKFATILQTSFSEQIGQILASYFIDANMPSFLGGNKEENSGEEQLGTLMWQAVQEAGIEGYDEATIRKTSKVMLDLTLYMFFNSPDALATLIGNIDKLAQAHDSMLCFAWLASMDNNYYRGVFNHTNNGDYRILKITGSGNVKITDSDNNVVVSYSVNVPQSLPASAYHYGFDGVQKVIYLPVTDTYKVSIDTTFDQDISVVIGEYSAFANKYVRVINYRGEISEVTMPAYTEAEISQHVPNGSYRDYKYVGNGMIYNQDFAGDYVSRGFVTLDVNSSSMIGGSARGSGKYMMGETVMLSASANMGSAFEGWIVDSKSISTDQDLRFQVTKDSSITAKFKFGSFKCSHSTVTLRNKVSPSCKLDGYSGDYYCTACGELVSKGHTVVGYSHSFSNGFCSNCLAMEDGHTPLDEFVLFKDENASLNKWIREHLEKEDPVISGELIEEPNRDSDRGKDEKEETKDDKNSGALKYIIAASGAFVVIAGITTFVVVKKKRKK